MVAGPACPPAQGMRIMAWRVPHQPLPVSVARLESTAQALPCQPTDALPGTQEKIRVLEARAAHRQELSNPADLKEGQDPTRVLARELRGRCLVNLGTAQAVRPDPGEHIPSVVTFGKRLRKIREEAGLSVKQLVRSSGLSQPAISHFECDRRLPSLGALLALARALELSLDDLVGYRPGGMPVPLPRPEKPAQGPPAAATGLPMVDLTPAQVEALERAWQRLMGEVWPDQGPGA